MCLNPLLVTFSKNLQEYISIEDANRLVVRLSVRKTVRDLTFRTTLFSTIAPSTEHFNLFRDDVKYAEELNDDIFITIVTALIP